MKRFLPILLSLLLLAGCKIDTDIRPDTIVDIPLEPTQGVTAPPTEEPTEATGPATEEPTVVPSEAPTEAPTEKAPVRDSVPKKSASGGSSKKTSGSSSKKNSGGSSKKESSTKATEAPTQTEPPTPTEPPTVLPTVPPTEPPTEPPTQAPTEPAPSSYVPSKLDRAIIDAINAQRRDAGLPELDTGRRLSNAAAQRARDLSITWNRTRPDGSDFSTVLVEAGCRFSSAAQNLFYTTGSASAEDPIAQWMDSDGHRENILSGDFSSIGVAHFTADGVTYIAALFVG